MDINKVLTEMKEINQKITQSLENQKEMQKNQKEMQEKQKEMQEKQKEMETRLMTQEEATKQTNELMLAIKKKLDYTSSDRSKGKLKRIIFWLINLLLRFLLYLPSNLHHKS